MAALVIIAVNTIIHFSDTSERAQLTAHEFGELIATEISINWELDSSREAAFEGEGGEGAEGPLTEH